MYRSECSELKHSTTLVLDISVCTKLQGSILEVSEINIQRLGTDGTFHRKRFEWYYGLVVQCEEVLIKIMPFYEKVTVTTRSVRKLLFLPWGLM